MPIGETLAAAREAAGLSVEDVAAATRIRARIVEAIEHDDFGPSAGDVYARGHIRSIAGVVGVDPAPLIAEYESSHVASAPTVSQVFEHDEVRERRGGPNWTAVMAAVLVIIVGVGIINALTRDDSPRSPTTVGEQVGSSGVGTPSPSASRPGASQPAAAPTRPAPSPSDAVAAVPAVKVRLKMTNGVSWVGVKDSSGKSIFEGNIDDGDAKTFADDRELRIILGNAGAASLTVNGKSLGRPGRLGEVVRLTFGPGDPTAG